MPITGAILGAGALSAGASAYGASQAAGASKSGLAQQQAQLDKVWSSVNPWLTAGQGALQKLQSPAASFEASPDYNFVKGEALNGVVQNKAVNGLLRSGSALTAVQNRAANLGSTEFGNWWNRQSGLATQGLDANRIGAGLAGTAVNAIGTNTANQGNADIAMANSFGQFGGSALDALMSKYGASGSGSSYGAYNGGPGDPWAAGPQI
jgi:hypothetical protein